MMFVFMHIKYVAHKRVPNQLTFAFTSTRFGS